MKKRTIISEIDERFLNKTFLLIRPQSQYYQINQSYDIVSRTQSFETFAYLRKILNYTIETIPEHFTILAQNRNKDLFEQVQKEVFNVSNRLTLEDCPHFLLLLEKIIGKENFNEFEQYLYMTFKPMTLSEIFEFYKTKDFREPEKYKTIDMMIKSLYREKKLSVLIFSKTKTKNEIHQSLIKNNPYAEI